MHHRVLKATSARVTECSSRPKNILPCGLKRSFANIGCNNNVTPQIRCDKPQIKPILLSKRVSRGSVLSDVHSFEMRLKLNSPYGWLAVASQSHGRLRFQFAAR